MTVAPHHLASQTGAEFLRQGANAVEAMLAMAATIAVAYPHMNGIGGDGFWLISWPDEQPVGIQACGHAGRTATPDLYCERGHSEIPNRGGLSALTVAGTVAGWQEAHRISSQRGGRLEARHFIEEAKRIAREGVAVSAGQERLTEEKLDELAPSPGFAEHFLPQGRPPVKGSTFFQPALAETLDQLGRNGFDDFYRGEIARALAADLEAAGSPLRLIDLEGFRAKLVAPLSVSIRGARVFNLPPPTQGLASLLILAILDRLPSLEHEDFDFVHSIVEATKQAFLVRNAKVWDPAFMDCEPASLLADDLVRRLAAAIDPERAAPWPYKATPGDTIWMGAIDANGCAVSFIQSLYWEFGSGVVSPKTGVLWQNRGTSFSLAEGHPNRLQPGRLPFHTLNPAFARFDDGRTMVYGCMGGEGQPQTQAAVLSRYHWGGMSPQQAITAPRWLLGRTWGTDSTNLKLEAGFPGNVVEALISAGHDVETVPRFSDMMGHAGAVVRHADGLLEGGADPRSDGAVRY